MRIIRNGDPKIQETIRTNDDYPISSIIVEDNGIGMNDENLKSFMEADSGHKLNIGGKGLGRFVCLKAFKWLSVESTYKDIAGFQWKFHSHAIRLKSYLSGQKQAPTLVAVEWTLYASLDLNGSETGHLSHF